MDELRNRFIYHPADTKTKIQGHENVRDDAWKVASTWDHFLPESREKSIALTKLEEAMFWANAAIARNL